MLRVSHGIPKDRITEVGSYGRRAGKKKGPKYEWSAVKQLLYFISGDISSVVAGNSRVVKPKCRQFTSLNKMFNNFSKVLIVDISYTALINNEGISGIREAPKRIKFTFSNLLRDVRDEKRSLMISGCQKCQSNLVNLVFALYFAYSGRFCHE